MTTTKNARRCEVEYTFAGVTSRIELLGVVDGLTAGRRALDYYDAALSTRMSGQDARCVIRIGGVIRLDTSWA